MPLLVSSRHQDSKVLSEEQLASFRALGYTSLKHVTSVQDAAEIRTILERLFLQKAGYSQGAYFDFAGSDKDGEEAALPQIMSPNYFSARLRKTEFRRRATQVAREILGPSARFHIDHTLMKPPGGLRTPWHQDEAFKNPRFEHNEISFWMPLQSVNEFNGCMEFIPESHQWGILPHRTPGNGSNIHAFECCGEFDPASAVPCPLPLGGCTIHHGRVLHGAGANHSDAPRYAYVLIFHLPPEPASRSRSFPWQEGKATERMRRRDKWLKTGGRFIQVWRFLRDRELRDYKKSLRKLLKKINCPTPSALPAGQESQSR